MTAASGDRHWIQGVYALLALLGVDPDRLKPNYETEDGRVLLALPDTQVAITTEGDDGEALVQAGWTVVPIPMSQMQVLDTVLQSMQSFAFEDRRKEPQSKRSKKTSKEEDVLLDAILRSGIARPERNYRIENRENGKELTTPDFVWREYKVAFFVDGLWWHQAKDDSEIIGALRSTDAHDKEILEGNKTRAERDGEIRSQMQADGWTVLSCTDRSLEDPDEVTKHVKRISDVITRLRRERQVIEDARTKTGSPGGNLEGLL